MTLQAKTLSIVISFFIFIGIIELVRRRKLREELSWIWLLASFTIFIIAVWENLLSFVSRLTGIIAHESIVFSFGILFLILINLQLSLKISKNQDYIKNLVQKISLIEDKLEGLATRK